MKNLGSDLKEFKINKFLTVKLEGSTTYIYLSDSQKRCFFYKFSKYSEIKIIQVKHESEGDFHPLFIRTGRATFTASGSSFLTLIIYLKPIYVVLPDFSNNSMMPGRKDLYESLPRDASTI